MSNKYISKDGSASIHTGNSPLSETTYKYPAKYKNNTIQTLLEECLELQAKVDELTAALNKYSEDEMLLSDKATITELQAKVDTVNQTLTLSLKNESDLEAKLIEAEERADEYYELNEKLIAEVEELTALAEPMTKALYKEMANRHTAITIENTELQAKVEKLDNFIELVEGALGCTDGDDIRTHIKPELAALKQENE